MVLLEIAFAGFLRVPQIHRDAKLVCLLQIKRHLGLGDHLIIWKWPF
jgi:hypothetical protein